MDVLEVYIVSHVLNDGCVIFHGLVNVLKGSVHLLGSGRHTGEGIECVLMYPLLDDRLHGIHDLDSKWNVRLISAVQEAAQSVREKGLEAL